jgi:NADP-dependent 3-hydroxy acid dehydrogenase YdfG
MPSSKWTAQNLPGLDGRTFVITGANSGIGRAAAEAVARAGAHVVLAVRDPERGARAAAGMPGDVEICRLDLADLASVRAFAAEWEGDLDVLVNNAGVMPVSPLDDLRVEEWEAMIDINIKGVLYGIAAALPVFRKQGAGQFVNIASTAGHKTVPNQAVYSGTKFAVRAISEGCAKRRATRCA